MGRSSGAVALGPTKKSFRGGGHVLVHEDVGGALSGIVGLWDGVHGVVGTKPIGNR